MLRRLRALVTSIARSVSRSATSAAILVIVVALLIRLAFAVAYVGTGRILHGTIPPYARHPANEADGIVGRGAISELAAVGGNKAEEPVLAMVDTDGYTVLGRRMAEGEIYPGSRRQPLYPALHALIFLTLGRHPTLLYNRLAGAVLSACLSGIIYLLGRRLGGHAVGLVAGLFSAVHLNLLHKSGYIYSEALAVPLLTLALYWLFTFTDNRRRRSLVLGGLMLGLATLTRPTTFYLIFLLPFWLWVIYGKINRVVIVHAVTVVAVALAVITPWAVCHAVDTGRFTPVGRVNMWSLLCGCYGPGQFEQPLGHDKGVWVGIGGCKLFTVEEVRQLAVASEREQQRICKRRFLEYISTAWPRVPELMFYRMLVFIGFDSRPGIFRLYQANQIIFFVLFLGGLWVTRGQWRRLSVLYLAYLYLGVFHVLLLLAGSRMRLYVDPLMIVFAAAYLGRLVEKLWLGKREATVTSSPTPRTA